MALKVLIPFGFSVWIVLEAVYCGQFSNACYGTDPVCDHYTIQCPDARKIQLGDLYAGYKASEVCAQAHCNHYNECCISADGDNKEYFNVKNSYDTYSNCSGKQQCSKVHAPWQQMKINPGNSSSYVEVGYSCVKEQNTISMCGSASMVTNSSVDIMYEGSKDVYDTEKICQCNISSSGQTHVDVELVDIRLERFHRQSENRSVANCSSSLLSTSLGHSLSCTESQKHYEDNFIFSVSNTTFVQANKNYTVTLQNIFSQGQFDAPVMVWIAVKGSNNHTLRVHCGKVTSTTTQETTTQVSNNAIRSCNTVPTILIFCLYLLQK